MLHIIALSRSALVVRHWFEINLDDASMEHGARIELRELASGGHRGSESAAQLIAADRPFWRADLFDRMQDEPGTFGAAHYHPEFAGNEPSGRVWDPALTADPWRWLFDQVISAGAAAERHPVAGRPGRRHRAARPGRRGGRAGPPVLPGGLRLARRVLPADRDARPAVRLMVRCLRQPALLDAAFVAPWLRQAAG